ncbi:MAG: hypothetical protein ABSE73_23925, partial [Planctomycetota bacterium]
KRFKDAQEALRLAKNLWPEAPDMPQVDNGISEAGRGLTEAACAEVLANAKLKLAQKEWDGAERSFREALALKKEDAAAAKGLEETALGRAAEALQSAQAARATADGDARNPERWAAARAAARTALDLARGDKSLAQKLYDDAGAKEAEARAWGESEKFAAEARARAGQKRWEAAALALNKALAAAKRADLAELKDQVDNEIARAKGLAAWDGNLKTLSYKGREIVAGARGAEVAEWPLLGHFSMLKPIFIADPLPLWCQTQEGYVIFDKVKKRSLGIYVIFTTAKNQANGEKTDWVGEIVPAGAMWQGDFVKFRQYDKIGGGSEALYYTMGRDFPMFLQGDGSIIVQENYWGNVRFLSKEHAVTDEMARRIIDEHDLHYREKSDETR